MVALPKDHHPPFFPFYVDDFMNDGVVDAMTNEEIGVYIRLLCKAWKEAPVGSVPDDDRVLAQWARLTPFVWSAMKPHVMAAFRLSRRDGRYHQRRMELEWAKLQRTRLLRSKNAQNAAKIRHSKVKEDQQDTCDSHAPRMRQPCATENEYESSTVVEVTTKKKSANFSEEKKVNGHAPNTKASRQAVFDEPFQEFRSLCAQAGQHGCLIGGDADSWDHAWYAWATLDMEQKLSAVAWIRKRIEVGNWDDSILKSLPSTVLAKKNWNRPISKPTSESRRSFGDERLRNA